jgi:hypothetical protein
MRVLLGNPAAKDAYRDEHGALKHRDLDGKRVTTVTIPDGYTLMEAVSAVLHTDGAWNHHSQGDNVADTTPDWVESDNEVLGQLLASQFGCPVGRPKSWKADA